MRVVATAGHVDHGKSALIRALTGTDPDRFPEEKARGLTIDLGFAFMELGDEVVGFVDVPGHVKFAKNMLAGVGAVEVAMLVVAANEGWMPQTAEHVGILGLLGVRHGLIVTTKADLVDDDTLEYAQLELAERLAGSSLAHWPVVACDALTGRGLDDVCSTLSATLINAPTARDEHRPRLWVDRSFSARGAGTVVTGTLTLGSLAVDDDVIIEPGHRRARVRGIESHRVALDRVAAGARVALNLSGIEQTEVRRGDAVVTDTVWAPTDAVDVRVLRIDGAELPRRAKLSVHVGSGEWAARCRLLDSAGDFARLRFDAALPLRPGDRVVLRSTARRATLGGGEVLDIEPARRTVDALARLASQPAARVVAARPWATRSDFVRLGGLDPTIASDLLESSVVNGLLVSVGSWYLTPDELRALHRSVRKIVQSHHAREPLEPGVDVAALASRLGLERAKLRAAIGSDDQLVLDRDIVRERDHVGQASSTAAGRRFLDALEAAPYSPPTHAEVGIDAHVVRLLVREGVVVDLDGVLFSAAAVETARRTIARAVIERDTLTVSEIRDLLGSTRKFILPIVKRLDSEGITRRRGDDRVAGPKAVDYAEEL